MYVQHISSCEFHELNILRITEVITYTKTKVTSILPKLEKYIKNRFWTRKSLVMPFEASYTLILCKI